MSYREDLVCPNCGSSMIKNMNVSCPYRNCDYVYCDNCESQLVHDKETHTVRAEPQDTEFYERVLPPTSYSESERPYGLNREIKVGGVAAECIVCGNFWDASEFVAGDLICPRCGAGDVLKHRVVKRKNDEIFTRRVYG